MSGLTILDHVDTQPSEPDTEVRTEMHWPAGPFRRPVRVAWWALLAVALHVVVDSYLDVRAGTVAGDHLLSGAVPLLVLVWLAHGFPRWRAGTFAVASVLVGVAVAVGTAGAHTSSFFAGDVRPATVSGVAATTAAVVLFATGAVNVARNRRRDGSRRRRWLRRTAVGVGTALAVLFLAVPCGLGYVAANRSGQVVAVGDLGAPHEDVELRTSDGLVISGAYVPSRNRAAVVLFPGLKGDGITSRARMLVAHGYGVLVFQMRGHGSSEGDPNMFGWESRHDVEAALDYLSARPDVDPRRIGGLGLSVGGELLIETAAGDARLAAAVSEGAGSRWVGDDLRTPFPSSLVQLPLSAAVTAATALFSDSLPPPRIGDVVGDIAPRPLLLIWASPGQGGEWFNPRYHDLAGPAATIWEIPDGAHTGGLATQPEEYERRVIEFLDDALLTPLSSGRVSPDRS